MVFSSPNWSPPITTNNVAAKLSSEHWLDILEYLSPRGSADRESIKSVSLTCRTLACPGQQSLYRFLRLKNEAHLRRIPIGLAAKIGPALRHLSINDRHHRFSSLSWPSPINALREFLKHCQGVTGLTIHTRWRQKEIHPVRLSEAESRCLLSPLRTQETEPLFRSLPYVKLVVIYEILGAELLVHYSSFLNCFPQLRHLRLLSLRQQSVRTMFNNHYQTPPNFSLEYIDLNDRINDHAFLDWLKPAFRHLRHLSLTPSRNVFLGATNPLLLWLHAVQGGQVTRFTIYFKVPFERPGIEIMDYILRLVIFSTPHLIHLEVHGLRFDDRNTMVDFPPRIASRIKSLTSLEKLTFDEKHILVRLQPNEVNLIDLFIEALEPLITDR